MNDFVMYYDYGGKVFEIICYPFDSILLNFHRKILIKSSKYFTFNKIFRAFSHFSGHEKHLLLSFVFIQRI
jgi:hypothetical protein